MALRQLAALSVLVFGALPSHLLAKAPESPETPKSAKEPDPLILLVRSLTPEQKARLIESIKAWQELTPEVKQALRAREKTLKKTVAEEIESALADTSLTPEQREQFEKRFKEERRKLDASLRVELETRRKNGIQEITDKLKAEVSTSPSPTQQPQK